MTYYYHSLSESPWFDADDPNTLLTGLELGANMVRAQVGYAHDSPEEIAYFDGLTSRLMPDGSPRPIHPIEDYADENGENHRRWIRYISGHGKTKQDTSRAAMPKRKQRQTS